ncbi:hypothetical protein J7T55_005152 [Diaporthe amygdali]|uniref:uncharacterized protein n=1 Tax=Phomopsis amygdali TaxID=1214568 RepID=UPI0022FE7E4B|nr:uncharacterized protein J7T55_005152 [Diaporthe amygdali]KAJ0116206.1 hypothetical protein J7T55_005152 [Diaporthe amygdali]
MSDPLKTKATKPRRIDFFGSKPAGGLVNEYNYTDVPSKLLFWDIYYIFYYAWSIPLVIQPLRPQDGNRFDELAWGWKNAYCVVIHIVLIVMQLGFLMAMPLAFFIPPWTTTAFMAVFWAVTLLLCRTLNGSRMTHMSDPRYTAGREAHENEQWLYINGISIGEHWLKNNLDRLALTFGRPVLGIHNSTYGIVFDLLECIVQRTFGYATEDIRRCYVEVKKALCDEKKTKVIFILHSQGGIEGGAIIDWLLQELPQNLLSKLEVYTFGNAANHFNNPYRSAAAQSEAEQRPLAAAVDAALSAKPTAPTPAADPKPQEKPTSNNDTPRSTHPPTPPTPFSPNVTTPPTSPGALAGRETASRDPAALSGNAIGHIEHYCHSTDFVALWGVLHFKTASAADRNAPIFAGRAFRRVGPWGQEGHLLCQHYLNAMFPLERDPRTGELVGCADTNDFMESEVAVRPDSEDEPGPGESLGGAEGDGMTRKVKELSRLWQYRNGRSPGVDA